jgi:AraC-like DNA-binding protein
MSIQEHYTHDASSTVQELTSNPVDIKLLSEAVTIIEANINDNDFDILFFARQLCLSRTQLFKKIKSLTGMTPNMFVLSIKLKRASQEILSHPDENIADIAYRCGFNTPSYFIKCFKKFYGMTPLSFRKQNQVHTT